MKRVSNKLLKIKSYDSFMLINSKTGDIFYTESKDKTLTAKAIYYGRKITTERLIIVTTAK